MSKRRQTENLHLYAYENLRGLPTFLKDWSDNMAILDGAHSTVLSLINGLDGRLTTAEGLIEDMSPESIEDYKIRLDALEKKVVINTNSIKDVNTKIATVNAQINSINTEQGVQNNRLDALETITSNHTDLLVALRTDLTSVDGRVTTLEQCCENVQHEITDLQSDVDGFNQDITVMAGQIETLSNAVNELTELVNSLQLDVVSQRLDAFEADLTSLTTRMSTAESNIVAHGATLEEHNDRITENAGDIDDIQNEIGDTDYSEIGDTVSSSLVELADRIRALTPQEYDELVARLTSAEGDIDTLQSDLQSTDGRVDNLNSAMTGIQTDVTTIQGLIPQSASSSNLLATNSDLPDITGITNALTVDDGSANATGLIRFGVDSNGNYGYKKVGADTVTPFKTGGGSLTAITSATGAQASFDSLSAGHNNSKITSNRYQIGSTAKLYKKGEKYLLTVILALTRPTYVTDVEYKLQTKANSIGTSYIDICDFTPCIRRIQIAQNSSTAKYIHLTQALITIKQDTSYESPVYLFANIIESQSYLLGAYVNYCAIDKIE